MNVLLSIKPKFVEEIRNGTKKYEFRKRIFRNIQDYTTVYIYSSSPIKQITGKFTISACNIYEGAPNDLWEQFQEHAGINKEDFFHYFEKNEKGYAINIENCEWFEKPIEPKELFTSFIAPQSFKYIEQKDVSKIEMK